MNDTQYYNQAATFREPDGKELVVSDEAVAEYTRKHMRIEDQKDIRRVVECAMLSFSILSKSLEPPVGDDWYYYDDLRGKCDLWKV